MRRSRRLVGLLSLLTVFTFVAAACGDDSDSSSATTGGGARDHGGKHRDDRCQRRGPARVWWHLGHPRLGRKHHRDACEVTQPDGTNDKVGMIYDVTGRGDQSFNDSAARGLDRAATDFGIESSESTPTGEATAPSG